MLLKKLRKRHKSHQDKGWVAWEVTKCRAHCKTILKVMSVIRKNKCQNCGKQFKDDNNGLEEIWFMFHSEDSNHDPQLVQPNQLLTANIISPPIHCCHPWTAFHSSDTCFFLSHSSLLESSYNVLCTSSLLMRPNLYLGDFCVPLPFALSELLQQHSILLPHPVLVLRSDFLLVVRIPVFLFWRSLVK